MLHGGSFFSLVPDFSKRLLYYTILLLTRIPLTKWPEERLAIMIILKFFFKLRRTSPPFSIYKVTTWRQISAYFSLYKAFLFKIKLIPEEPPAREEK